MPTKTWRIQWVPLKWKFTCSHIVINGKAPLFTEHGGKDELHLLHTTASITADVELLMTFVYCRCPSQRTQGMVWSKFFPSTESKNWEAKQLYLSHTCATDWCGWFRTVHFVFACLQWANNTCCCHEFCKFKVLFIFPRAWKMQLIVKLIW